MGTGTASRALIGWSRPRRTHKLPGVRWLLSLLFVSVIDCGAPEADDTHDARPSEIVDAGSNADASTSADTGVVEPCAINEVPLIALSFGDTARYYVKVRVRGATVALELDTGSNLTFLAQGPSAPSYTPHADDFDIGCEHLPIAGRGLDVGGTGTIDGAPVVGLLGMDYLLGKPSVLDPDGRSLARHRVAPDVGGRLLAIIPFDTVQSLALVPATLDGSLVRLMFDTGGETLWVGVMGQPGDQRQDVIDAEGTVFPVWIGTATLTAGDFGPRRVRIARAPAFPYFEDTIRALGGNLHGLLGLDAFPNLALLVLPGEIRVLSR